MPLMLGGIILEPPGDAEQIEIRAVFLKDYKPYGSFSPIYTATVAP